MTDTTETAMRERIARVIYDALEGPVNNGDATRQMRQWELSLRIADAVLDAMREGTATHKKRGSTYDILGSAVVQTDQPLYDMDSVVVYRSHEDGFLWVRRYEEMYDGRFEISDAAKEGR